MIAGAWSSRPQPRRCIPTSRHQRPLPILPLHLLNNLGEKLIKFRKLNDAPKLLFDDKPDGGSSIFFLGSFRLQIFFDGSDYPVDQVLDKSAVLHVDIEEL